MGRQLRGLPFDVFSLPVFYSFSLPTHERLSLEIQFRPDFPASPFLGAAAADGMRGLMKTQQKESHMVNRAGDRVIGGKDCATTGIQEGEITGGR